MKTRPFLLKPKVLSLTLLSLAPILLCSPAAVHAQWEPDRRLTFDDSASYTSQSNAWSVAASPGGLVHVVWYDNRDLNYEIYYKRSTDYGVSWSNDYRLTFAFDESAEPCIGISGSDVHVVWRDNWEGKNEIYYLRSTDAGITWQNYTRLSYDTSRSCWPSLAVVGSMVYVVWEDWRHGNTEIYFKYSTDAGVHWGPEVRLTEDPYGSGIPSISALDSMVHVVWQDDRSSPVHPCWIYHKRSNDFGSSWSPDSVIVRFGGDQWYPCIAVTSERVHVVWAGIKNGNQMYIYYRFSTDHGCTWDSSSTFPIGPSGISSNPSVCASGPNVHVVCSAWRDIYYTCSTDYGANWSGWLALTNDPNTSAKPSIALSDSMLHLVWWDNRNSYYDPEIYYKRNPTGNLGVEENVVSSPVPRISFSVVPNPFTSFTTLPGHSADRFALYDVSGRRVGVYKGDRIGEGLVPGVYFIQSMERKDGLAKIVKIR